LPCRLRDITIRQIQEDSYFNAVLASPELQPDVSKVEIGLDGRWRASASDAWHCVLQDPAVLPSPAAPLASPAADAAVAEAVVDLCDSDDAEGDVGPGAEVQQAAPAVRPRSDGHDSALQAPCKRPKTMFRTGS
jgi:hypothetical protein